MKSKKDKDVFVNPEETIETEVIDSPVGSIEVEVSDEIPLHTSSEYIDGVVTAKMLAVRENPSTSALMIRVLYEGTKVNYKKHNDEWYELIHGGYCMSKFIQ